MAPVLTIAGQIVFAAKLALVLARHEGNALLHEYGEARAEEGAVDEPVAELGVEPHLLVLLGEGPVQ